MKKQGSNQFKTRYKGLKKSAWRDIIVILTLAALVAYVGHTFRQEQKNKEIWKTAWVQTASAYAVPTPTPFITEPTKVQTEIIEYIREVFGKDSDKAFQLLSCENASLNPDAVNTAGNYPEGSRDIGVFQINEYWQGVQGKYLFNWKINVEIAKQLFDENGGQFNLWSCGKRLGI